MAIENLDVISAQVEQFMADNPWFLYIVLAILVWKLIWYGLAIYKSIERKQKSWFTILFVCAFVLNDLGLLPIVYLLVYRDKKVKKK
jgi:RsiW-degrading membrane proteinase PrsW (M82 family)